MPVMYTQAILLNGDFCADLGHLFSDLFSLFSRDAFFNGLWSLINHSLRLFQTQAGQFAYNFDDIDLVATALCQNGVKLSLLLGRRCSARCLLAGDCGTSCSGGRGRAYSPPLLQSICQVSPTY